MNRRLVKDLEHMYLVFDIEDIDENEYLLQMALRGRLPSLLPLSVSRTDGKKVLRADVTGCTSIASRYQSVPLKGSDIRKILMTVNDVIFKLPGYLMDPGDLCLDPECIFFGPGGDEILLCYIPHQSEEDPDTIRILAEFFLKKLDHSDRVASDLSYGLFDKVSAEHYMTTEVLQGLLADVRQPEQERQFDTKAQDLFPDLDAFSAHGDVRGVNPSQGGGRQPEKGAASGGYGTNTRQGAIPQQGRGRKYHRNRASRPYGQRRVQTGKKHSGIKRILPALIILPAAAAVIFLFHMDLTQVGGMGFLSVALIWLSYSAINKRRSEIHNVWADEDDPGDDAFYQSLLKQVYASDADRGQYREENRRQDPYPQRAAGRYEGTNRQQDAGYHQEGIRNRAASVVRPCLLSLQADTCPDVSLSSSHMILGKSREKADIILPDDTVSRVHARIEQRTDGFYVSDLYSTNGTWLDDRRLESGRAVLLKDGAVLRMGSLKFRTCL